MPRPTHPRLRRERAQLHLGHDGSGCCGSGTRSVVVTYSTLGRHRAFAGPRFAHTSAQSFPCSSCRCAVGALICGIITPGSVPPIHDFRTASTKCSGLSDVRLATADSAATPPPHFGAVMPGLAAVVLDHADAQQRQSAQQDVRANAPLPPVLQQSDIHAVLKISVHDLISCSCLLPRAMS